MKPSASDYKRLYGVSADLVMWVEECYRRFGKSTRFPRCRLRVNEGVRDMETQIANVAMGVSWTLESDHLTGDAVDLIVQSKGMDGWWRPRWERQIYERFAELIGKPAADDLGLMLDWGGDWERQFDGPHWGLKGVKA